MKVLNYIAERIALKVLEFLKENKSQLPVEKDKRQLDMRGKHRSNKVLIWNADKIFLFQNAKDAARFLGRSAGLISRKLREKRSCAGYGVICLDDLEAEGKLAANNKDQAKKVLVFNEREMRCFLSMGAAAKFLGYKCVGWPMQKALSGEVVRGYRVVSYDELEKKIQFNI